MDVLEELEDLNMQHQNQPKYVHYIIMGQNFLDGQYIRFQMCILDHGFCKNFNYKTYENNYTTPVLTCVRHKLYCTTRQGNQRSI